MYAVYARQSVNKKESISIEMQVELCKSVIPEKEEITVFEDKGFSGTNTKRPAFQEMLSLVRLGRVSTIVVYKLDRISRSLADFAWLLEELEAVNVKLLSCSEGLDTKTPMGQMLVKLLIMFAEMEQKMISARIRDNYHARAEKMMPLGGVPPFGFDKNWEEVISESRIVRECYKGVIKGESLDKIGKRFGFTGTKVARIIRNTAYVMCSNDVIRRLIGYGCKPDGKLEDFRDGFGIVSIKSQGEMYIAPGSHRGFIEPELWLSARDMLDSRKTSSNSGSGNTSYIGGLIICGKCGNSCYIRDNGKGRPYLYITCRGRRNGTCKGFRGLRLEPVEKYVTEQLFREMEEVLNGSEVFSSESSVEIAENEKFIISELKHSEEVIPEKFFVLDRIRETLLRKNSYNTNIQQNVKKMWKGLAFSEKKAVVRLFVKNIIVTDDETVLILR